jgi:microcystin-dependent protein
MVGVIAVIAVLAIASPSAPAASVTSLPRDASVLFAHRARSGSFTPARGHAGHYTLILRGVVRGTTWFSDRPRREAGRITTRSLLGSWSRLGYAAEPPNAAVVLDGGHRARDTVALELRLRRHDSRRRTARFSVRVLQGLGPGLSRLQKRLDRRLPRHFAGASLFIDDATSTSCTVGQPRLFAFSISADESSYIPADGRLLAAAEYPGLFKFYGTEFGGDGQETFRAPNLQAPLPGMSWQVCADGVTPTFKRMPNCLTGELVLWSLGDTPVSAVDDEYWLPADGRTVAAADYPTFAARYLDVGPPSTFALPNVPAPPGFVYLACVYGDDSLDLNGLDPAVDQGNYLAQVDLFTQGGYPADRAPGGRFLSVPENQALFQLLGTTYGGDGEAAFVTPAVPSPVAHFAYLTATWGLFPSG